MTLKVSDERAEFLKHYQATPHQNIKIIQDLLEDRDKLLRALEKNNDRMQAIISEEGELDEDLKVIEENRELLKSAGRIK